MRHPSLRYRPSTALQALVAAIAVSMLAGCASRAAMDARHEQSLQRWKGATRAELLAAWGKPLLAKDADGTETLTYVTSDDIRTPQPMATYSAPTTGAPIVSMPIMAPTVPMRCTTRFQLRDGVVTGWTFEGLACGAPTRRRAPPFSRCKSDSCRCAWPRTAPRRRAPARPPAPRRGGSA
ncbi:MAG TPA: hypothetical protein VES00_08720 [Burkholderiaceae bacterium]|nr:hypothetical protein [Burkholderiaceae bacterium]